MRHAISAREQWRMDITEKWIVKKSHFSTSTKMSSYTVDMFKKAYLVGGAEIANTTCAEAYDNAKFFPGTNKYIKEVFCHEKVADAALERMKNKLLGGFEVVMVFSPEGPDGHGMVKFMITWE